MLFPFSMCFLLWIVLKSLVWLDDGKTSVMLVSLATYCSSAGFHYFSFPFLSNLDWNMWKFLCSWCSFFFIILFNIEILFSKVYHFYKTEQQKQVLNPGKFAQPLPFTLEPVVMTPISYVNTDGWLTSLLSTGTRVLFEKQLYNSTFLLYQLFSEKWLDLFDKVNMLYFTAWHFCFLKNTDLKHITSSSFICGWSRQQCSASFCVSHVWNGPGYWCCQPTCYLTLVLFQDKL